MTLFTIFMATLAAFALTAAAIRIALPHLEWVGAVDEANGRSGHRGRIPNAGGVILLTVALLIWTVTGYPPPLAVVGGLILLTVVSCVDDVRPQSIWIRLGAQAVAVVLGLGVLIADGTLPADGPMAYGWILFLGLGWLWFINGFNFMDGADGLAGSEAVMVLIGLVAVGILGLGTGAILIGALLGFLILNWHPARIFLGDGGSVPLGYLLAFWLVAGVNGPDWAAAMILPAYFCWDATLTIFHRWCRGEKLTQGHRRHAYQQAIDRLGEPRAMTKRVLVANVLLLGLALVSPGFEILCILLAAAVVHSLISWMKRGRATAWLTL
ncbi:MAG: glycosyl transferase [Alphaproteobacteria bacterium]|nr:glycosyl transferase [Alphaproteobacteria bacterium]